MTPGERQTIEATLRKLLDSGPFKASPRMARFLTFVVEHTLSENPEPLKEYLIGTEVFDRGDGFDPRQDTIVRVEARRLRAKLREYYEGDGRDDPVAIDLPDRGYAPSFRFRRQDSSRAPAFNRRVLLGSAVAVAAVVITGLLVWILRDAKPPSIMVLPFQNLSPSPADEYIGEGFTEEITNALAAIPELRVARTSALRFKSRAEDVRAIGRLVNAQWVLEGSIRKDGQKLRVIAHLADTDTRLHVWSQAYDAEFAGLIAVQQRIAAEICQALKVRLSPANRSLVRSRSVKPEAHEAYLKGRYFWYRFTPEALDKSVFHLNEAVRIDPGYVAAHAALADSYSILPQMELSPPRELLDKAKAAAERALALDADSADAHFAAGVARAVADRDPAGAEREYQRALELNPNLNAARQAYAVTCLSPLSRHDQAIKEMRRVVADDPASPVASLVFAGRVDDGIRELQVALDLEPGFLYASQTLAMAYLAKSAYSEARIELERTPDAALTDRYHAGLLGYTCGRLGDTATAERILGQLRAQSYVPPMEVAGILNGLGRTEEALQWLERAYQDGSPLLLWVAVDPRFVNLRDNRTFLTLIKRMGLPIGN